MALAPGTRLGAYEILSLIGSGGMGEVYRARDTKLGRDVALKILPDSFAGHPERLARFQREAQVLASLNHPHIGAIYGLEESDGVRALVLELVEGPTLADRIAQGAIPLDEVLPIARQIAEALEAAHEQGIVHRDLKPANIALTNDGQVKVLDFGLAKATEATSETSVALANSPTRTSPAMMTDVGVILGTAAYMSPEQAKGRAADKRSDVWAFGCVLYEMLTGKRAFEGEDISDTLTAVLRGDPDWTALPADTPPAIRRLLRRCLEKDRTRRLPDVGVARLEIDEASTTPSGDAHAVGTNKQPARWRRALPWAVAVAALVVAGAVAWIVGSRSSVSAPSVTRVMIDVRPADGLLGPLGDSDTRRPTRTAMALSPNGRQLVFSARQGDTQQLYLRAIDRSEAAPISGTKGGDSPFFSPDGQWVGFWANGGIKKVALAGGPPVDVCRTEGLFGASWGSDDGIVFARSQGGLWRVPAAGGEPQALTKTNAAKGESSHRLPHVLPGAEAVLFTIVRTPTVWSDTQLVVQSLKTGKRNVLVEGAADGRYVPTGYVVYARMGSLLALPFDATRLEASGGAVGIVDDVMQAVNASTTGLDTGAAQFAFSASGTLVYVPGGPFPDRVRSLTWVDRSGAAQPLPASPRGYVLPRVSPDGTKVAVMTLGISNQGLWVYDLSRNTLTRLAVEGSSATSIWTPDGTRVTFAGAVRGLFNLFWIPADGSGPAERLGASEFNQLMMAATWSSDARQLLFVMYDPTTGPDIWVLARDGGQGKPRPLFQTRFRETYPDLSPDGRWLAYVTDESGRNEVYVVPYPGPGARRQISIDGGRAPAWSRNGKELFYLTSVPSSSSTIGNPAERMMVVDVTTGPRFSVGTPRMLFETPLASRFAGAGVRGYDVTPDGRRFITVEIKDPPPPPPPTQMHVVLNWFDELKARVPTK